MIFIVGSYFQEDKKGGVSTLCEGRYKYLNSRFEVKYLALGSNSIDVNKISLLSISKFKYFFFFAWLKLIFLYIYYRPSRIEIHNIPVGFPLIFFKNMHYFFHGPAMLEASVENKSNFSLFLSHLLEMLTVINAKKIYFISNYMRDLCNNLHPYKNKYLCLKRPKLFISNKVPLENLNEVSLKLVCVRRLVSRTGVMELLKALKICRDHGFDSFHLNLVGDGPLYSIIQNYILDNRLTDHVTQFKFVDEEFRDNLYKNSHYNVVPTQYLEGFGLIILESGINGCPSVVTNVAALPEVINVHLSGNGIICEKTPYSISEAIMGLKPYSLESRKQLQRIIFQKFVTEK